MKCNAPGIVLTVLALPSLAMAFTRASGGITFLVPSVRGLSARRAVPTVMAADDSKKPIYLDYSGTTPVDGSVIDAMLPYLREAWGNPSSSHYFGQAAAEGLEKARGQVADSIGCSPGEIFFTSGGTESNNWALKGAVYASRRALQDHFTKTMGGSALSWSTMYVDQLRPHVVTTAVEHPAVLEPLKWLQREQLCDVSIVPVGPDGVVKVQDIIDELRSQTVIVSVMHANNEVGAVQPIAEITAAVKQWAYNFGERGKMGMTSGILVHSDASQTLGKIDVNVGDLGVDLLSLAGHKLYAPKGVGALYIKGGVAGPAATGTAFLADEDKEEVEEILSRENKSEDYLMQFLHGAGQEQGLRAGTENVALSVAMGAACDLVTRDAATEQRRQAALVARLHLIISKGVTGEIQVNGPELPADLPASGVWPRLPNTLSLSFRGIMAADILKGVAGTLAASAGAACHSSGTSMSAVLEAMGVSPDFGFGTIRLSVGRHTTEEEVDVAGTVLVSIANSLWTSQGVLGEGLVNLRVDNVYG